MMHRPFLSAIALLLVAGAAVTLPAVRALGAPPSPALAAALSSSATGQVTNRLATDLTMAAKDAVVFVSSIRSDETAPRGAELAGKLATLVAGALGPGASARPEIVSLATAQTLARGAKSLVYLQLEIARGQLRATADLYRVTRNIWDRARQPVPTPIAHAFAAARIDGEVRSFLAPAPLVAGRIDRATTEDRDLLALACGDVDDSGALEIVTLGRRRATIGRALGGRFVPRKIASMRDLSGIAPSPLREPLGGLAIVAARGPRPAYIDLGITDRAHGSRLDNDLRPLGVIIGVPFTTLGGDACITFQGSTLLAGIARCSESDAAVEPSDIGVPLDAAAVASFVTIDGTVHRISATRDPRTAELTLKSGDQTATIAHAGAQIAVADLDQDGSPEIISTLDVAAKPSNGADSDALVITTWQPGTALRERARTPVPSGIRALAACPPDGAGAAPVVIATSGELWIIR